jgi:acyl-phosphate glycerol 3-phosphate acyltransferase
MLELGLKTLLAYLLGSVIGGLIVGRLRGGVDIRMMGSGNAGGTNALRTQGLLFAIWVIIIDAGKGWVAAGLLPALELQIVMNERSGGALPRLCGQELSLILAGRDSIKGPRPKREAANAALGWHSFELLRVCSLRLRSY